MKNLIKTEQYTGTIESAKQLAKNLRIENNCVYNKSDRSIKAHRVKYMPGDFYSYAIHEEFKVI